MNGTCGYIIIHFKIKSIPLIKNKETEQEAPALFDMLFIQLLFSSGNQSSKRFGIGNSDLSQHLSI